MASCAASPARCALSGKWRSIRVPRNSHVIRENDGNGDDVDDDDDDDDGDDGDDDDEEEELWDGITNLRDDFKCGCLAHSRWTCFDVSMYI